jgi:deoxyribodipyrimidine photolyase-related protein
MLDDPENSGSFTGELRRLTETMRPERIVVTEAAEWRVVEAMEKWEETIGIPVEIRSDSRFLCSKAEFSDWARGRRSLTMEYFYRDMRRRTGLLMNCRLKKCSRVTAEIKIGRNAFATNRCRKWIRAWHKGS